MFIVSELIVIQAQTIAFANHTCASKHMKIQQSRLSSVSRWQHHFRRLQYIVAKVWKQRRRPKHPRKNLFIIHGALSLSHQVVCCFASRPAALMKVEESSQQLPDELIQQALPHYYQMFYFDFIFTSQGGTINSRLTRKAQGNPDIVVYCKKN